MYVSGCIGCWQNGTQGRSALGALWSQAPNEPSMLFDDPLWQLLNKKANCCTTLLSCNVLAAARGVRHRLGRLHTLDVSTIKSGSRTCATYCKQHVRGMNVVRGKCEGHERVIYIYIYIRELVVKIYIYTYEYNHIWSRPHNAEFAYKYDGPRSMFWFNNRTSAPRVFNGYIMAPKPPTLPRWHEDCMETMHTYS